jgi:DNA-binding transcriptional MerR regulator
MRLAWLVYGGPYPGKAIRQSGMHIVRTVAEGDVQGALALARSHLALVHAEQAQADLAAALLEQWAFGPPAGEPMEPVAIGQAARLLDVTIDVLRNWERNGLIDVPRDPGNGYRRFGAPEISRLRVIRMLSHSGYSIAAILRMLLQLDRGESTDLRHALDTPRPDEDVYTTADRWLTTLAEQARRAQAMLALVTAIVEGEEAGER